MYNYIVTTCFTLLHVLRVGLVNLKVEPIKGAEGTVEAVPCQSDVCPARGVRHAATPGSAQACIDGTYIREGWSLKGLSDEEKRFEVAKLLKERHENPRTGTQCPRCALARVETADLVKGKATTVHGTLDPYRASFVPPLLCDDDTQRGRYGVLVQDDYRSDGVIGRVLVNGNGNGVHLRADVKAEGRDLPPFRVASLAEAKKIGTAIIADFRSAGVHGSVTFSERRNGRAFPIHGVKIVA